MWEERVIISFENNRQDFSVLWLVLWKVKVASRRSPQGTSLHQIKLHNAWGLVKRTKTSPSKMPDSNDADMYGETRAHPENIKVRRVLMYQPWLVSHPNGWSDKGSLFGGPGEMLSRSHALTPRDVYRDVIIAPEYFVNALPKAERRRRSDENPAERYFLVDEGHAINRRNWLVSMSALRLALFTTRFFIGDDRCRKTCHSNGNSECSFIFSKTCTF